jgi:1,2-dihydroxy-3-keto-5-methylthiopentene dioxygenase
MKNYKFLQVDIKDRIKFDQFVDDLIKRFPISDVFETDKQVKIETHTHDDFESRLFIEGNATFYFDDTSIDCQAGTYIELPAGLPHSFKYDGDNPLKVLRFFSKSDGWIANYS